MRNPTSTNPISGRKTPYRVIACISFFTVISTLIFLCFWSYVSWDAGLGATVKPAYLKPVMWLMMAFSTHLRPLNRATLDAIFAYWQIILALELILNLLFFLYCRKIGNFSGVEHGSAHWARGRELRPFRKRKGAIPLAHKIFLSDKTGAANGNVFVLGAPGAGKSFCVTIPVIEAITRCGGSFIATDTKGALYRDTVHLVRDVRKMPVYVLNLADPFHSYYYNPLMNVHKERKYIEIGKLALAFSKNARDEEASVGDAIWEETFQSLINAIWFYQYDFAVNPLTGEPETKALWRTAELILSIHVSKGTVDPNCELSQIIDAIRRGDPLHPAVAQYDFVTKASGDTITSVLFTAGSKVKVFTHPAIECLTRDNEIPLDKICEDPSAVYVNMDIGSPYRVIAALFMEQCFNSIYYVAETKYDGRLSNNMKLLLDELPNFCRIHSLPERAATSRSYNCDIFFLAQSLQQIQRMFDKSEKTLLNNCVTHVYLGSNEPDALKQISEALGKTTTEEMSRQENQGFNHGGGSITDKGMGRELALPSEMFAMANKYAIVKTLYHQPIFTEKFKTQRTKYYRDLGGKGNPKNNRNIETDLKEQSAIHRAEWNIERRQRSERRKENFIIYG